MAQNERRSLVVLVELANRSVAITIEGFDAETIEPMSQASGNSPRVGSSAHKKRDEKETG